MLKIGKIRRCGGGIGRIQPTLKSQKQVRTTASNDKLSLSPVNRHEEGSDVLLVLDGVKMGASISIDGVVIGQSQSRLTFVDLTLAQQTTNFCATRSTSLT